MAEPERVVLLHPDGSPAGTALKATVHTRDTPLHLAFSCYLFNTSGEVLVTRRALSKKAWPGVWTNSFCGHPAPGEDLADAVRRRAGYELDATVTDVELCLPDFRYRASDADGTVENEICPVFVAHTTDDVRPNPAEVAEWAWVDPLKLVTSHANTPFVFTPWLQKQLPELHATGALTRSTADV